MASVALQTSPDLSWQSWQRETVSGRRLKYILRVLQQPERARACGSGAKSSADRRPVDPPPVVELRIFELHDNQEVDITFSYEANFFLFATLEVARPMAHARGQAQAPSQQVPVLTGMPVSGMAYLDRPQEAGYFIFPDLSVRHEGIYKLSFNLYEETKKAEDMDKDTSDGQSKSVTDASFDWRMEVKSDKFTVYSAKKFPGLTESTALSRTVAEQGCRVRIRRDVRMRRRDDKPSGNYEEQAEDEYARQGRPIEQEYRSRSASSSPNRSYHGSPVAPNTVSGSVLAFLDGPQAQFAAPGPPQYVQPAPSAPQYQPPQSYHQQPPSLPPFRAAGIPPPPSNTYGHHNNQYQPYHHDDRYPSISQPHSAYPSNPPREQREFEPDRRASVASYQPSAAGHYPTGDAHAGYNRPYHQQNHGYAPRTRSPILAPLKMGPTMEPKPETLASPYGVSMNHSSHPMRSPLYENRPERGNSFSTYAESQQPSQSSSTRAGEKRGHHSAFPNTVEQEPLYDGMRPRSSHSKDSDDEQSTEELELAYRRATGEIHNRRMPGTT